MSHTDPALPVLRCRGTLAPRDATGLTTGDHPGRRGPARYDRGQAGTRMRAAVGGPYEQALPSTRHPRQDER